jgi:hypothetical protein
MSSDSRISPHDLRKCQHVFLLGQNGPVHSEKHPDSARVFRLRRYLIGFLFVVVFVLLDRTTVYLQILPEISAWYPPVGIALALSIGMGPRYAAIACFTPFCLVIVMPVIRRFAGLTQTTADMAMVMDGLEATRNLNELGTARRVPIITITANAFDDDRRKCFEAGMHG